MRFFAISLSVVFGLLLLGSVVGIQEGFSLCLQNGDLPDTKCFDETFSAWYEEIPQNSFEVTKTKSVSFGTEITSFRLFDVEDSRCPSDVHCVWEGQVTVNVGVKVGLENLGNYSISLNDPLDLSIIQLDQYSLQLVKVEPYPTDINPIDLYDYVVTMKFSEIEISSPLKQIKNGILHKDILCKEGLELIFKPNDSPSCVKPSTAEKLIERGWTHC